MELLPPPFMMRPNRPGLRPGFPPFRPRGPLLMDPRLRHPLRPPLPMMRGGPPVFPPVRPLPPPGRPRGMGLLPLPHRPPMLGPPGPLGPRGLLPPPRHLMPLLPAHRLQRHDLIELNGNTQQQAGKQSSVTRSNLSNVTITNDQPKTNPSKTTVARSSQASQTTQNQSVNKNKTTTPGQNQDQNAKNIGIRNRRPLQSAPASIQHPQRPPGSAQPLMNVNTKPLPLMQTPALGIPPQVQGPRGNRMQIPPRSGQNMGMVNRMPPPNGFSPAMANSAPSRPTPLMSTYPIVPPSTNSYHASAPSSLLGPVPHMAMKRPAPPPLTSLPIGGMGMKRMRYDAPVNGSYGPGYQQSAHSQNYNSAYESPQGPQPLMAATPEFFPNSVPPYNSSMASQDYGNEYNDYQMTGQNVNSYSQTSGLYNNGQSYTNSYGGYDTSDYSNGQQATDMDPYGYANNGYDTSTGYDDYSGGYADENGYGQSGPVDQSYMASNSYSAYQY